MRTLSCYSIVMCVRYEGEYTAQVVGLRYFNVYGPNEAHKDKMASLVRQMFYKIKKRALSISLKVQMATKTVVKLVTFIYVKDVVNVNFYFWEHPEISGTFNCGTGNAHSFNQFMQAVIDYNGHGKIEYVPFPEVLKVNIKAYRADTTKLLAAGYDKGFHKMEDAVKEYCELLDNNEGYLR